MASGVSVTIQAKAAYDEIKIGKKHRYIIYHINDERAIDVENVGPRDATYSDLLATLQGFNNECRYCVFDFPANIPAEGNAEPTSKDKLILVTWCPEAAPENQKRLYSNNCDGLKNALGLDKFIKASNVNEASQESIEKLLDDSKGGKGSLNPFAAAFVPRFTVPSAAAAPAVSQENGASLAGMVNKMNLSDSGDYTALTELRHFMDEIRKKPENYDQRLPRINEVFNTCIEPKDSHNLLQNVVETIMDQAVLDIQFRYNGARLLVNFLNTLNDGSKRTILKEKLVQRCQRDTDRRDALASDTDRGHYLRGLATVVGDVYSGTKIPELGTCLAPLLESVVKIPSNDNVKCASQVLKLCGEQMERQTPNCLDQVLKGLEICSKDANVGKYLKEMAVNTLELKKNNWKSNQAPIYNPYLNNQNLMSQGYAPSANAMQQPAPTPNAVNGGDFDDFCDDLSEEELDAIDNAGYYFGGEDNDNPEVADAFEEFLRATGQR